MIIDKYTKIVLTIIALSLVVIAFSVVSGTLIESALAQVGNAAWNPLYGHIVNN